MTPAGIVAILLTALPALAFVLWPFFRRNGASGAILPIPSDRSDELNEEKTALYRALRELEFDHQAGHLSEDDYAALRSRYEARAGQVLKELDSLPAPPKAPGAQPKREPTPAPGQARSWTRSPLTLLAGAVVLVIFGLTLGLGIARYTEPERTTLSPGSRLPAPGDDPSRPVSPETLLGMLQAAHQSLDAGRYQEAIAAYQAVLKRDPQNVEAITHVGVILGIAGHTDEALQALDRAIAVDPGYAHAWWDKARILYEQKQDYRGAIQAWEKFVAIIPEGEDRDRALRQIQEARGRLIQPKR